MKVTIQRTVPTLLIEISPRKIVSLSHGGEHKPHQPVQNDGFDLLPFYGNRLKKTFDIDVAIIMASCVCVTF